MTPLDGSARPTCDLALTSGPDSQGCAIRATTWHPNHTGISHGGCPWPVAWLVKLLTIGGGARRRKKESNVRRELLGPAHVRGKYAAPASAHRLAWQCHITGRGVDLRQGSGDVAHRSRCAHHAGPRAVRPRRALRDLGPIAVSRRTSQMGRDLLPRTVGICPDLPRVRELL